MDYLRTLMTEVSFPNYYFNCVNIESTYTQTRIRLLASVMAARPTVNTSVNDGWAQIRYSTVAKLTLLTTYISTLGYQCIWFYSDQPALGKAPRKDLSSGGAH